MKKIDTAYIFEKGEVIDGNPLFAKNTVIRFFFTSSPENVWSRDKEMIEYCRGKNATFKEVGLLSDEILEYTKSSSGYTEIAVELPNLETAERVFHRAVKMGIVDIYVYDHGTLHMKYD